MTPLEELPEGMPTEAPQTDCEAVKKEWDEASKTGRVSAELMQKALECQLVPEDKVKSIPTGEGALPTREENPLAGEDEDLKDLGMAELVMAEDDWYDPVAGLTPGGDTYNPGGYESIIEEQLQPTEYVEDSNGNWVSTAPDAGTGGGFDPLRDSFVGTGRPYAPTTENRQPTSGTYEKDGNTYTFNPTGYTVQTKDGAKFQITYYDKEGKPTSADKAVGTGRRDLGGLGTSTDSGDSGRITNMINPNYFSRQAPQKPDDMGNMEWYYKYGGGMYQNAFNPESFYFNPYDKGNAGQISSPYTRIGNGNNMTPEVVKSNRPFYNDKGINNYTDAKRNYKNRLLNMAEATDQMQTPTGADVDQLQGQVQEVDEQIQEQLKEAIINAGFNVVDIGLDQEGKIFVTVGQFEDSYMENAQFITFEFGQEDEVKAALKRLQKEMYQNPRYIEDTQRQMLDYGQVGKAVSPIAERAGIGDMTRTQTPNYFANQLSRFMTAPIRTANNVWTGVNNWANNTTIADAARWAAMGGIHQVPQMARVGQNVADWYRQDTQNQFRGYPPQSQVPPRRYDDWSYTMPRLTVPTNNFQNPGWQLPQSNAPLANYNPPSINTQQPGKLDLPSYRDAMFSPSLNFTFAQQMDEANSTYFEQEFELAEPQKCSKRFKAIAVTPGVYAAKDGTQVELSSEMLQNIAGLFRNKPLVLVDHELARPDSTHEGGVVGFIENSWYDPDFDAVLYKGVLNQDLDLAGIAGSSIKLSYGKYPMGRHIALIPKCMAGKTCYAPQDPNAVILENAQRVGDINMGITQEQAFAIKKELESINKQKESLIDGILKKEIEAGTLKGNIFDRTRELWKSDAGVLLEMATVIRKDETPSTKPKVEGKPKEFSLAKSIEKGEIDPEEALTKMIESGAIFGF